MNITRYKAKKEPKLISLMFTDRLDHMKYFLYMHLNLKIEAFLKIHLKVPEKYAYICPQI